MSTLGISDPAILEGVESLYDIYESGFGRVSTLVSIPLFRKRFQLNMRTKLLSWCYWKNYYEAGICACRSCNNIKFPLYVLKVLKLYLFCLPMLIDFCSYKLCDHKIPRHRKWVIFKCASNTLHDAFFMFQFLSFMWASLKSSCLAKSACWETTQYLPLMFLCVHMINLMY